MRKVLSVVLGAAALGFAILGLLTVMQVAGTARTPSDVARALAITCISVLAGYAGWRSLRYGFGSHDAMK